MLSLEPHLFLNFRILFFIYISLSFVIEIEVRHDVEKTELTPLVLFLLKGRVQNRKQMATIGLNFGFIHLIGFLCMFHG